MSWASSDPHEHLLLNMEWIDARFTLDGILDDAELMAEELRAFRPPVASRLST